MKTGELTMSTPYYVLIDHKSPLCTRVADPHLAVEYSAIFGFSDKSTYDTFNRASTVPLRPYPLVKGYLQSQLDEASAEGADERCIKLVILNASGPHETNVHAATLSAVLEARESGVKQLEATHYLTFNPASDAYRLET